MSWHQKTYKPVYPFANKYLWQPICPKKPKRSSSGFFFSPFIGWYYPSCCIFLSVGFFCTVLHRFTYQGFNRYSIALHPCSIRCRYCLSVA